MTTAVLTTSALQARVAAGVAWLDVNDPGWWKSRQPGRGPDGRAIDLDELSMSHPCYCVLGHRFGSYMYAPMTIDQAVALGFDTASGAAMDVDRYNTDDEYMAAAQAAMQEEFDALTRLWAQVIRRRRASQP
jgi:hypothetical protein